MTEFALRIRVAGRVQGVWFRAWTKREAETLGLSGWVRNCADGSVEALAAGPEPRVRELVAALHRGPEAARVRDVSVAPADPPAEPGFRITG